ncbi:tripartite tricarboxylate transporter substrate binding protein [Verticiella sediminum]|uniref:Tripartite tricarboxylate transporter substrate binding protein n=1 Tax=Verticiella sediminum TaxID=1247510 RepID=A0A556AS70_9BURK|nr:tripartite tricarboxylate transporter substrate binding protein [Verticiella sediminum]TSH95811.1 tripartite tricarboxylate transporter substrate binding protein [Verticiella sediminum]
MKPVLAFPLAFACALAAFASPAAVAADKAFPERPVKLIVPFAPGGTTDTVSRRVAQGLSERWGQPVVVENKPGAGTVIGVDTVAKAPADGYTLGTVTGSFTVNPSLLASLPYDSQKDLRPIASMARSDHVLVARQDLPADNAQALLELVRAQPGKVSYGSFGNGSSAHLAGEMFAQFAGTPMLHVPYKGQTPALADLIGGQIDVMFANLPEALPQLQAGKVKAIGVAASERSPFAPDIPTLREQGIEGVVSSSWNGLIAPAGVPDALVERINADVNAVLEQPTVRESLAAAAIMTTPGTPQAFGAMLQDEMAHYADVVRQAGIKAQ